MKIKLSELSQGQLQMLDRSLEAMIFKQLSEEPFEDSYKKNPKNFRKFINNMVDFKRELAKYFDDQYQNRYRLISYPLQLRMDEGDDSENDDYSEYLYDTEWQIYQDQLASILEKFTSQAVTLGILSLALSLSIISDYTSADKQQYLIDRAYKSAGDITTTTKNRVVDAIKASLALNEDRAAFEDRIKGIFKNPYRGRFIAHEESINGYMQGKSGMAVNQGMQYKICLSSQANDEICGDHNGEIVPINAPFGNGMQQPQFHFGCRCDVAYSASPNGPFQ